MTHRFTPLRLLAIAVLLLGTVSCSASLDLPAAGSASATAPVEITAPPAAPAQLDPTPIPAPTETIPTGDASIQVYFTSAAGQQGEKGALEEALLADLAAARQSIDIAMYNFSLRRVADALLAAQARGVTVRMVTDSDSLDGSQFARLKKGGVPLLGDRRQGLMHDKFLVIDHRVVWTGSLNLTGSGTYTDNNNFARFESAALAQNYTKEFEEMFLKDLFGPYSPSNPPQPPLEIGGVQVENYFSPDDRVASRLAVLIRGARQSVDFLAYSFTSDTLAKTMLERAGAGVTVRGVFEDDLAQTNTGGEYLRLKRSKLDVRLDGNPGLMHHKVIILDGETVIFGSYNFTTSAERTNDENVVVVYSPAVAAQFEQEFARVYAAAHE